MPNEFFQVVYVDTKVNWNTNEMKRPKFLQRGQKNRLHLKHKNIIFLHRNEQVIGVKTLFLSHLNMTLCVAEHIPHSFFFNSILMFFTVYVFAELRF